MCSKETFTFDSTHGEHYSYEEYELSEDGEEIFDEEDE